MFNVVSADLTFGQAAGFAAEPFGARVVADPEPDPCNYRVDATKARQHDLLDELPTEDLAATVPAFVRQRYPHSGATPPS